MADVRIRERARPGGELQKDAVRVHEIDRPDEGPVVDLVAHAELAVVVVHDVGGVDALGPEPHQVLVDLVRRHVEGHVVHGPDGAGQLALPGQGPGSGHSGRRLGRDREPEECERVTVADVEEEVLAHVEGKLDRLDERHAQDVAVEVDRPFHVAAHEGKVVDPPQLELAVHTRRPACHVSFPSPALTRLTPR
jgi:hypothetical protein